MDMNGFNEQLLEVLNKISSVVWGPAMLILLLGTGLYYTVRLRGLAFTKLLRAFKEIFKGDGDDEGVFPAGEGSVRGGVPMAWGLK